jgi:hypothetical protein
VLLTENEDALKLAAAWPSMVGSWIPGVQGGRLLYESPDAEDLETFLDSWASADGVPRLAVERNAVMLLWSDICRPDFTRSAEASPTVPFAMEIIGA